MPIVRKLYKPLSDEQVNQLIQFFYEKNLYSPNSLIWNNLRALGSSDRLPIHIKAIMAVFKDGSSKIIFAFDKNYNGFFSELTFEEFNELLEKSPPTPTQKMLLRLSLSDLEQDKKNIKQIVLQTDPKKDEVVPADKNPSTQVDLTTSCQQFFIEKKNRGIFFLHMHTDVSSWIVVTEYLKTLKNSNVKIVFVEILSKRFKYLFDEFNKDGDIEKLNEYLSLMIDFPYQKHFIQLAKAAHQSGIMVLPVDMDSHLDSPNPDVEDEVLLHCGKRNIIIADNINKRVHKMKPDEKFIGLFGLLHKDAALHCKDNVLTHGIVAEQFFNPNAHPRFSNMLQYLQPCAVKTKIPNLFPQPHYVLNSDDKHYEKPARLKTSSKTNATFLCKLGIFACIPVAAIAVGASLYFSYIKPKGP